MIYYVSSDAERGGDGSKERPFIRIGQAAEIARAGDEILVKPGIYRESVNPRNSGTKEHPIVYRSLEPQGAVIKGSERIKNWEKYQGNVWSVKIPNGIFSDYNPYLTELMGDWYYSEKRLHTGEVYLNGKSMYEDDCLDAVLFPEQDFTSWEPEFSMYKWFSAQENNNTIIYANFQGADPNKEIVEINVRKNCFYPCKTGINYITLSGFSIKQAATAWAPPTAYQEGMVGPHWSKGWIIEDCEISDSKCCGISLGKYLQPNNENKWSLKRLKHGTQTERDAICQAQREGWSKENIGSHIVRRCNIHHCEQAGIVGHLGGVFSVIEDNHIHHINNKQQLLGAEIGGIKMHAAIDVIFRRNHIHHCTRGLWLDWQAQGTRVTQNLFHDNMPPQGTKIRGELSLGEDIFVEVSHGPTLIDNNIMLSAYSCKLATQGVALVHNIICGPFTSVGEGTDNAKTNQPRYTPYHVPHGTEVAGFMTFLHGDDRFYNNIFVHKDPSLEFVECRRLFSEKNQKEITGTNPFCGFPTEEEYLSKFFDYNDRGAQENRNKYYEKLPIYTGGNVYFNGAEPCDKEVNFIKDDKHKIRIEIVENDGIYYLDTNLGEYIPEFPISIISTEILGKAFEPEERFEHPDGSEIIFDEDYFGKHRNIFPLAGPFSEKEDYRKALFK